MFFLTGIINSYFTGTEFFNLKKLAIITTHPIQYNAPLFAMLHQRGNIAVKVFYTWGDTVLQKKYDPGFGKAIEWDIPLLDGYDFEFVNNTSKQKGSHHFNGIINPAIILKINAYRPDAILVYGWKFNSHLKVIRYFKNKIPVLFRGDSILLDEKKDIRGFVKRMIIRWVYTHIDKALYCGTNNRNYFQYYGLRPDQLIASFHAVDNRRFGNLVEKYAEAASLLKSGMGICPSDLVLLYAGKLIAQKNIQSLIRAFEKINNEKVHLVIAGNGPEEQLLKNNFSEIKNLHFLDFQNQQAMPILYQVCDIFVLPSNGETWGLSVNEAMAAGKAILISDKCGSAIDLVINGINGYIFETGNVDELYSDMKNCISDLDHLKKMQHNSYQKIQEFKFDKIASAIEKIMKDV